MPVSSRELGHLLIEPQHPPQTPLSQSEIHELAVFLANATREFCQPDGQKYVQVRVGEPKAEIARIDYFSVQGTVPATVEISTSNACARTALDEQGKIHAFVSKAGGPFWEDSQEARDEMRSIVQEVFSKPLPREIVIESKPD